MPTIKFNLTSSHNVSLNCKFNDSYSYFMTDRKSVVTVLKEVAISITLLVFSLSRSFLYTFSFLLALKTNLTQRYAVSLPEL